MIDLRGSKFTDIMPENLASQLETQAFAYALGRQIEKLCAYADGAHSYAAVDSMPEKILDVLAVELRTPTYNQNFSVEVKRTLTAGTLPFYARLGTPAAAERMITAIFRRGRVEGWFAYDGEPHHFRAFVDAAGAIVTPESLTEFRRTVASVKRLSSWLDGIVTNTPLDAAELEFTGVFAETYSETALPELRPEGDFVGKSYLAAVWWNIMETALPEIKEESL